MRNNTVYESPELVLVAISSEDIISTSPSIDLPDISVEEIM